MSLEAAILGFLSERPRSGYDLKTRCFDETARPFWTADQAQIYRTLERLQAARLVSSTRKRQSGKPDRRVYDITPAGRDNLSAWLSSDQPLSAPREPFLLQLFFAAALDDDALLCVLAGRRAKHQARLDDLRARAIDVARAAGSASPRQEAVREAALDGAMATERAALDWLDDTIEAVKSGLFPAAEGPDTRTRRPASETTPA